MNTAEDRKHRSGNEHSTIAESSRRRIPLFVLALWIANVTLFLIYFAVHTIPRLAR